MNVPGKNICLQNQSILKTEADESAFKSLSIDSEVVFMTCILVQTVALEFHGIVWSFVNLELTFFSCSLLFISIYSISLPSLLKLGIKA